MDKKIAVLCMIMVTVGIFVGPKFYFENIDTRLMENRQEYRYNVKIEDDLSFSDKKEMLLNYECLVDIENAAYELKWPMTENIIELLYEMNFENPDMYEYIQYIGGGISESLCFKLVYVEDEVIKTLRIGTCIFSIYNLRGIALYDASTYQMYIVYVVDYGWKYDEPAGFKSIFKAEELLNSKTINNILGKTALKTENEYIEKQEWNMLDLFTRYLEAVIGKQSEKEQENMGFSVIN